MTVKHQSLLARTFLGQHIKAISAAYCLTTLKPARCNSLYRNSASCASCGKVEGILTICSSNEKSIPFSFKPGHQWPVSKLKQAEAALLNFRGRFSVLPLETGD
jgi:hypothetical protein